MKAMELIEKAMKKADGAQASISRSEDTNVDFESDKLKTVKCSQSSSVSVRVVLNGKIGTSNTTNIDDPDSVVEMAIEAAEFGKPVHFEFPGPQEGVEIKIYDEAVVPTSKQDMVRIGEEMKAVIKEYNADILVDAGCGKSVTQYEFANSAGASYSSEHTGFGLGVHGQLISENDMFFAGSGFGWKKREIDHIEVAQKAKRLFEMGEKIVEIKSGNMPVIFPPESVKILLMPVCMGISGKNVFLGMSPIADKLGQQIANDRLTIIDNPLIDYASSSGMHDGEGVAHRITPVIEKGVLKNFLYDLDTAGRAGTKSTGHGIGCGITNTVIAEGDTSYEEMIKGTKEGLLVYTVIGLGQSNAMNGDISVNVQLGFKIENGEIVGRVKNVMLAGNVYDALKKIDAVGDESECIWGSLFAPPIRVGSMSVVAK